MHHGGCSAAAGAWLLKTRVRSTRQRPKIFSCLYFGRGSPILGSLPMCWNGALPYSRVLLSHAGKCYNGPLEWVHFVTDWLHEIPHFKKNAARPLKPKQKNIVVLGTTGTAVMCSCPLWPSLSLTQSAAAHSGQQHADEDVEAARRVAVIGDERRGGKGGKHARSAACPIRMMRNCLAVPRRR